MKKLLFISLAFLASYNIAQAQEQIYWSEVSMEVEPGDQGQVYEAVNNFYSNLEFPENVSVQLMAWQAKTEWREGTHFLNFAGSVEGMAKLRELRSGDAYDEYVSSLWLFLSHADHTRLYLKVFIKGGAVEKLKGPTPPPTLQALAGGGWVP